MTSPAPLDLGALTMEECMRYLATPGLGRVAVSVRALPAILPVRFVFDDGEILFRTQPGSVLTAGTAHTVVAFETDGADHSHGTEQAWSVVATGLARHVAADDDRHASAAALLARWTHDRDDVLVALCPSVVTGRRVSADW